MYQILRSCKFELYLFSRCYGNQSNHRSHYETLRIPQTSSQKEIREAFIKLSKEMHPDIKGKESESEFVKVNEAYKVLSKENLRREYDINIKHGYSQDTSSYPPYYSYSYSSKRRAYRPSGYEYYRRSQHPVNKYEWDEYVQSEAGDNYYGIKGLRRLGTIWIAFMCVIITSIIFVFQIISINKAVVENRQILMKRSAHYQREFRKLKDAAEDKTKDQQLRNFESEVQKNNQETSLLD